MSPYKWKTWLCAADQDRDSKWLGGRRAGRVGIQIGGEKRAGGGDSIPKELSSFIPKIESSISFQPTTLQDWK